MLSKFSLSHFLLLVCCFTNGFSQSSTSYLPIIPRPVELTVNEDAFTLNEQTKIILSNASLQNEADWLNAYFQNYYSFKLEVLTAAKGDANCINLVLGDLYEAKDETYTLKMSGKSIDIKSKLNTGIFYGLQSLIQMLPTREAAGIKRDSEKKIQFSCVNIKDYPRYEWRGMHLDVCRHFFPPAFIKKYIDLMALYKMNTFHWHLTEDQGWRIEIKKYPKLTEIGAWRKGSMIGHHSDQKFDSIRYGGFYTQEDIKDIVAYAQQRHITIVPEIEMPGHSVAAIAAYPFLSCTGKQIEVEKSWGVFNDVYCPKEETFKFIEEVLTEVMALFPGKYIHIGGDECPKENWKKCEHCQALMKKENIKNEHELQSYFITRVEKFVNSKGRQIIGWDEILEGGLAPNAAVMSWRGTEGGIAAARQKHKVVMSPGSHCYFDHYQGNPKTEPIAIGGYTTVEKVYSYEPTPKELNATEKEFIMGAQGNVWTEYINSPEQVEYMALPRMAALAEVLWTPAEQKNYDDFRTRLIKHFQLLSQMGVYYSRAIYELKTLAQPNKTNSGLVYEISSPFNASGIRYTIDGTAPDIYSPTYIEPLVVDKNLKVKCAYFDKGKQMGVVCVQDFSISKSTGKKINLKNQPSTYYPGDGDITLINGIKGDLKRHSKDWIGLSGDNLEAEIDLGKNEEISKVSMDALDNNMAWIYLPQKYSVSVSTDGKQYKQVGTLNSDEIKKMGKVLTLSFKKQAVRYVKVFAENMPKIPEGQPGAGEKAWLFVDEISID